MVSTQPSTEITERHGTMYWHSGVLAGFDLSSVFLPLVNSVNPVYPPLETTWHLVTCHWSVLFCRPLFILLFNFSPCSLASDWLIVTSYHLLFAEHCFLSEQVVYFSIVWIIWPQFSPAPHKLRINCANNWLQLAQEGEEEEDGTVVYKQSSPRRTPPPQDRLWPSRERCLTVSLGLVGEDGDYSWTHLCVAAVNNCQRLPWGECSG